jgi:hypothetical protein
MRLSPRPNVIKRFFVIYGFRNKLEGLLEKAKKLAKVKHSSLLQKFAN